MLGVYENFPENIHRIDSFKSSLSSQKLQQKLMKTLHDINRTPFSFEEVSNPTLHNCTVIFEFGLAENESFNFLDADEAERVLDSLKKQVFQLLDFFLAVRYYKVTSARKTPLKFDYYMIRFAFTSVDSVDLKVFHERGPRYVSPEDIVSFLEKQVNGSLPRKILKKIEQG
jgi:hypothetical protein